MRRFVFAAFALTVLAGCQPAPSNDDSSQIPLSPQVAVAEVRQVFQQYKDDWNAGDIDAVLAILDERAVQMSPDSVFVGKEAVSARFRQFLDENTDAWEPMIDEIQAAGNLVFLRWIGTETWTPRAGGETNTSNQKGVTVFRRDASHTWKLVLEQFFAESPSA